jgi:hypothetical protein
MGAILALAAACCTGEAQANAFDDCVLENMRGVTSEAAAKSIKTACVRKASVELSADDVKGVKGLQAFYGTYSTSNTSGFTVEVKNDTTFIVTEITFGIQVADGEADYFKADNFMYWRPGVVYAGLPSDPTVLMRIDPLTSKMFQFSANKPEIAAKKKWTWFVAGAKGIPAK